MDKVTVVVVTYNRPFEILERSIRSVLRQSYPNYELIVVNDTPKDSVLFNEVSNRIQQYSDSVKYFAEGVNYGACHARNYGANLAVGKYIAFLDDDDEWVDSKLEKQVEYIKKTDSVMVTCRQNTILEDETRSFLATLKYDLFYPKKEVSLQDLLIGNSIGGCSRPLILKEAFDDVGGFDVQMPASQDCDLWIRLATIGKISCMRDKLVNYYVHSSERISSKPEKRIVANKLLVEKYTNMAVNKSVFLKNKYLVLARVLFSVSKFQEAETYYRLAKKIRCAPSRRLMIREYKAIKERLKVRKELRA